MMRTRPAASRNAFERPPWQGWELAPQTAPSTQRSRASPTARLPCARPCPRTPGHRHCPSAQALGPLQGRSEVGLGSARPALLRIHSPPQTRPLRPGGRASWAPRWPDVTSSSKGRATAACSPRRGFDRESTRHRGDTGGQDPALPLAPGSRGRGSGAGAGAGGRPRTPPAPSRRRAPQHCDPQHPTG